MNAGIRQGRGRAGRGLREAVGRIGDRWSLLVVDALADGPRRWRDLRDALPGIAPNVLADRLRRLEREGVVASSPYSRRPLRLSYELTEDGAALTGVLRLLAAWGGEGTAGPAHRACGTPTEVRWFCPTCATTADDAADDVTVV
ncbi:MAG TPA: helix-turn-helix domain-containing protein [Actinomycetota bacterium]|nr:helix-turn-helix domain-containing protein [Actinomycetota bacterium]